ncbi:MAG TPA: hypothetical protein VKI44_35640 [Acetobacteraceae bacterium]|nr:hypothetical protein [Acetobacteraceae bacterium]
MTRTLALAAALALLTFVPLNAIAAGAYEGQISGDFHGWDGNTIYKLMDGHIIQQTEYHYHYHYAYAPHVIIYQSAGGSYKIHVEDDDDQDIGITVLK